MTKTIEKDISKEEYKLKISNNRVNHSGHSENSVPTPQNRQPEKLIEQQTEQINNLLSLLILSMDKLIRTEAK